MNLTELLLTQRFFSRAANHYKLYLASWFHLFNSVKFVVQNCDWCGKLFRENSRLSRKSSWVQRCFRWNRLFTISWQHFEIYEILFLFYRSFQKLPVITLIKCFAHSRLYCRPNLTQLSLLINHLFAECKSYLKSCQCFHGKPLI